MGRAQRAVNRFGAAHASLNRELGKSRGGFARVAGFLLKLRTIVTLFSPEIRK
jgi:hypothetical protein